MIGMSMRKALISILLLAGMALGQTQHDNLSVRGTLDARTATTTFPDAVGLLGVRPATCVAGQTYFATDTQTSYRCVTANTWLSNSATVDWTNPGTIGSVTPNTAAFTTLTTTTGNVTNLITTGPVLDCRSQNASTGASAATNDTALAACFSAIDATTTGGTVYLPQGVYSISAQIARIAKRGWRFVGSGADTGSAGIPTKATVLKWTGAAAATMMQVSGGHDFDIANLTFDCNGLAAMALDVNASVANGAVDMSRVTNVSAVNCTGAYALHVGSADNTGINDIHVSHWSSVRGAGGIHQDGTQTVAIDYEHLVFGGPAVNGASVFIENGGASISHVDTPAALNKPALQIGANNVVYVYVDDYYVEATGPVLVVSSPGGGTYDHQVIIRGMRILWNPLSNGLNVFDIRKSGSYTIDAMINAPGPTGVIYIHPDGNLPATILFHLNYSYTTPDPISEDYDFSRVYGVEVINNGVVNVYPLPRRLADLPSSAPGGSFFYCIDCYNVVDDGATAGTTCSNTPTSFTDNFNRADGALGANWTDTTTGSFLIASNAVKANATPTTYSLSYWNANTVVANQYSQVDLVTNTVSQYVGVGVRLQTGAPSGYFLQLGDTDTCYVQRIDNGTPVALAQTSGCTTGHTYRLTALGSQLTVTKDGTTILGPVVDTTYATGRVGLMGFGDSASATIDNWQGGSAGGSGSQARRENGHWACN